MKTIVQNTMIREVCFKGTLKKFQIRNQKFKAPVSPLLPHMHMFLNQHQAFPENRFLKILFVCDDSKYGK